MGRYKYRCLLRVQSSLLTLSEHVLRVFLDDQTQVDSKPACQPEHARLNQSQLIAP